MTDLPPRWRWAALGEIADVVGGVTKDSKLQSRPDLVEVPYLRVANVQRGRIDLSSVATIRVPPRKAAQLELQSGDVLLNEGGDRDKLGRGWVWQGQIPGCIHQNHVFRARIRDGLLHPKLLAWYANEVAHKWFELNGKQSVNLASISLSKVRTFPVPVPPVEEQLPIVEILEYHLSRLNVAENCLAAASARCEAMVTSALLVDEAVASSPRVALRSLLAAPLSNGRSVPTSEGGFPVLRLTALKGDRVELSERKPGAWTLDEARPFLVQQGDFMVARGNGSLRLVGRGALVRDQPDPVAFPDTLIRLRVDQSRVLPDFLSVVWNSPLVRRQIESLARTTAGIYKVNQKHLESVVLPVPNRDRQSQVCARLDQLRLAQKQLTRGLAVAAMRSASLRRSLLDAAFSGQLTGRASDMDLVEEMAGV
ncbi:restriction endonuclease subunit S [Micromonospora sp. WMMD1082]|uniref:restriction endonuclease subunit S n=1 Tax=Micromonospora sp. WMMD1082 TaxID=3016104 RepID=UPI00241791AA|nr:restriction endonuclease subunit S [Micromonospora sp. WMMD1082]MDG4793017.1 restriction endonuclease subunit S [Micromonospora sp. WMMD1082]